MVEEELASAALAITDDLTGLSNRRGFQAIAGYALARAHREGGEATLLYFDLDDFKPINDSFGHAEGDRALRDFANILLEAFRDSDIIARLGGDEFGVLLSGTARIDAHRAVDRFTTRLAQHNAEAGRSYSLAFSAGAVSYEYKDPPSPQLLLEQADKLMYEAKQRHKNRSARVA
jgi:diguanylate cyclase (GGDEF)-like protein